MGGYNPGLSAVAGLAVRASELVVALGIEDIVVDTEVGYEVILVPWVLVFLELIRSSSLGFALDGVAGGD